jgi:uncharacterized RmlC-like cupin family protein
MPLLRKVLQDQLMYLPAQVPHIAVVVGQEHESNILLRIELRIQETPALSLSFFIKIVSPA